ncbi:MAG TPA: glycosyltransferase, partial [Candidatus Binataceae bacterium]|nr:glycosyltransferase [Candidatus Binataceae bacterium]
ALKLAAADPRVEVRVHETNRGHIDTYNEGLGWAGGAYTVVLDSDDLLTQGSLRRACDLFDAHPEVGIVYGRVRRFYDYDLPHRIRITRPTWRIWRGDEWFAGRCRMTENCVCQPSVVMRTRLLKQVGLFRHELPHTADMEMWLRLSLFGDVGYIGGTHQALYRVHSASMHRSRFGTVLADLSQVASAFEALFHDYRDRIADAVQLEESNRRMLARRALDAAGRMYDQGRVDAAEVIGLIELALKTYPDAQSLDEWRSLNWRRKIGPGACLALRPFLLFTAASRSWRKVKRYRLHRQGLL